jgi:hypothetical protein
VMIHFWQRDRSSIENSATFTYNTCLPCARAWNPALQPAARPICVMNSYDWFECLQHYNEGNPYYYELPEWDPLGCSYFQSK